MTDARGYQPEWVSSPGDTILALLRSRGITTPQFIDRMGESAPTISALVSGQLPITIALARRLQFVLGSSVEFWMCRDALYRDDCERLSQEHEDWLTELPTTDMIKFGWIPSPQKPASLLVNCLRFFGVSSVAEWHVTNGARLEKVAFRTSEAFPELRGSLAAWLRKGELEAQSLDCMPWSPRRLEENLESIRSLTREKNPARFLPKLVDSCAAAGVAMAIVRAPKGCRASGATRFLTSQKAMLLLSFRYLSDDHFWFSFFHEVGHLLLHRSNGLFLEGIDAIDPVLEEEANDFAAERLIPHQYTPELQSLTSDARKIIRFASKLQIAPGIVVGQMQHRGYLGRNQQNSLKRRFEWTTP